MKTRVTLALSLLTFVCGFSQTISTFAGNGIPGYSGDGGQATAAEVNFPFDVKLDPSNNIYIADLNNYAVRKVDATTGIITTVAGIGAMGFTGDGGQATAAEMGGAAAVALDNVNGLLYIATSTDSRIRVVNISTGIITTMAGIGIAGYAGDGGPASAAELNIPEGVEVDSAGNVLIADVFNHVIRRIIVSTGIINTYAGNGIAGLSGDGGLATAAELNTPLYIRKDLTGNMFISDGTTNVVRRVDKITGIITTVAGNSVAGYSGDGGLATAAEINSPGGVGFDNSGNMFISDWGNSLIREVANPGGIITSVVGNDFAGYSGDGGPATAAEINQPESIVLDASGNMYIADDNNNRVRMVTPITTRG